MANIDEQRIFSQFPVIQLNDDLVLREPRLSDAPEFMEYLNQEGVSCYIPDNCLPKDVEHAKKELQYLRDLFNRRYSIYWIIATRGDNKLIGSCGFEHWNKFHHRLELAYDLHPKYWRQGITTLALYTIFEYAFNNLDANRIEAFTTVDNEPSITLLSKFGFEFETTLREYRMFKGKYIDINLYSYLKSDHEKSDSFLKQYQKNL